MNTRLLMTAAIAALVIGSAAITSTAQAAVAGPSSGIQGAAQSLSLTDQVRRICQQELSWTDRRWDDEQASYTALIDRSHSVPN